MADYQLSNTVEYRARSHINIYDSPQCDRLATQMAAGRHLRAIDPPQHPLTKGERKIDFRSSLPLIKDGENEEFDRAAIEVRLCEDDYPGWLNVRDLHLLDVTQTFYHPAVLSEAEIEQKLPDIIAFTREAMARSNYYLWGGTVGPNYDCSGLMQAAFVAAGIWLPRDAYQQEAFTKSISVSDLEPGDLVFFGTPQKATHVGLYLGDASYIHSSGIEQGRNGIGIDVLSENGDKVSQTYYRQLRGYGKVVASLQPLMQADKRG
jgi:NlpC/P60 family/Bacterial dipeptidyl-peptidase Sh3 domain